MEKLKIALLVVVAALLVAQVVSNDLARGNLREVHEQLARIEAARAKEAGADLAPLKASLDQLTSAVRDLRAQGVAVAPHPNATADAAARDGKPKLGVNFLLPEDRSYFHPEWVGGELVQFEESPNKLNAITGNSTTADDAEALINDSLCGQMGDRAHAGLWTEGLAQSLVISDDWKVYTFTIRKGVKWQRPAIASQAKYAWLDKDVELTARDFVFRVEILKNPDVQDPQLKAYWDDLDKAEAVDDYTLRLTWKRKVYTSLDFSMGLKPLPRHVFAFNEDGSPLPGNQVGIAFNDHWFDRLRQEIGVGSYLLDAYEPDVTISFRRNPGYWGTPSHIERLRWDGSVKNVDARLVAFKNGQAQIIDDTGLTASQYKSEILDGHEPRFAKPDPDDPKAGRKGDLGWERVKYPAFSYIGWNMRTPILADKRVRQALTFCFPKQRIISDVFYGLGIPTESDVLPDSPYYNHDLKPHPFDPEKSKALLAEAGWSDSDGDGWLDKLIDGKRVTLRFNLKYIANRPDYDRMVGIYKDELRKIGIDLQPMTYEWKELLRIHEERDFDSVIGAWRVPIFTIDYFQLWHSSQADLPQSSNMCGFKNAEVDDLSDKLRTTFDVDERIAITKRIQAILYDEQPYTFFKAVESIFVWRNRGENALYGVGRNLDEMHPLLNRDVTNRPYWHLVGGE